MKAHLLSAIITTALIPMAVLAGTKQVSEVVPVSTGPDGVPDGLSPSDWQGIREAYEEDRHAVSENEDGTLTARNPSQQWTTHFDGRGFLVVPDHGQWTWGLRLIFVFHCGSLQTSLKEHLRPGHTY